MSAELFPVDQQEMISEIDRELEMRRRVYPRWVEQGRLTKEASARRLVVLQAIRDLVAGSDVGPIVPGS